MPDLVISEQLVIRSSELEFQAIRAQGAGGQHVNKVSSAIHLRFDVPASSLPDEAKQRILAQSDQRISKDGVVVIKSQNHRNQDMNRDEALQRLRTLIQRALHRPRKRKATKPSRASVRKRLDSKTSRGRVKNLRGKVDE